MGFVSLINAHAHANNQWTKSHPQAVTGHCSTAAAQLSNCNSSSVSYNVILLLIGPSQFERPNQVFCYLVTQGTVKLANQKVAYAAIDLLSTPMAVSLKAYRYVSTSISLYTRPSKVLGSDPSGDKSKTHAVILTVYTTSSQWLWAL